MLLWVIALCLEVEIVGADAFDGPLAIDTHQQTLTRLGLRHLSMEDNRATALSLGHSELDALSAVRELAPLLPVDVRRLEGVA